MAVSGSGDSVTAMSLDPRLHAFRPDLADMRLKGKVESARFVEGTPRRVVAASAPMKRTPTPDAPLDSEVLRGETFTVFEDIDEGWSWGQLDTDSYVGYVPSDALGSPAPEPTHRVTALRTFVYPGPDLKLPAARLPVARRPRRARRRGGDARHHLSPARRRRWRRRRTPMSCRSTPRPRTISSRVAERFVGTPYLWGGRTSLGLDCSGLVQLALMTAGHPSPRDTDMQETMLGEPVEGGVGGASPRRSRLLAGACRHHDRRRIHAPRQRPPNGSGDRAAARRDRAHRRAARPAGAIG